MFGWSHPQHMALLYFCPQKPIPQRPLNLERERVGGGGMVLWTSHLRLSIPQSLFLYTTTSVEEEGKGRRKRKKQQLRLICCVGLNLIIIQLVGYLLSFHFMLKKKSRLRELNIKQTTCPMLSALLYYNVEWKRSKLLRIFREEPTG